MANGLDEMNDPILEEGRDVNVINKQIPVKVGVGSTIFQVILWILFIIPGVVFLFMKIKAGEELRSLEQKLQHNASQIDNYLEQRVMILQNLAQLLNIGVDLEKEYVDIAKARSGKLTDAERNGAATQIENFNARLNLALEAYPNLNHGEIQEAIKQNNLTQREITAAREVYNSTVYTWNSKIQQWPKYMIVAAKAGYTTRIPFATTKEIKQQARGTFFGNNAANANTQQNNQQ